VASTERLNTSCGDVSLEKVSCPVCGATDSEPAFDRADRGTVVLCRDCGLLYLNPRPREVLSFYDESYFSNQGHGSSYSNYLSQQAALAQQGEHPGQLAVELLARRISAPAKRLLDVGCGEGGLLEFASRRGFEATGIELSAYMAKQARRLHGVKVIEGRLEAAGLPGETFEVVTALEVIEHLTDPLGWLREVRRILKPGGLLLLTTPNALCASRYGSAWLGFHMSFEHLTFFEKRTIAHALRLADLHLVETWTRGRGMVPQRTLVNRIGMALRDRIIRRAIATFPSAFARPNHWWQARSLNRGRHRPYGHTLWALAIKEGGKASLR
jgi:2-polyprenyl-3-methyl-5-hydroxy-6-metoxy-1,4-benzoquinol methylase